jgi:flagellar export protein FliJ
LELVVARTSFKFRLQRLLDVRIMREQQAQQELLARRHRVTVEERRLLAMKQEQDRLTDEQNRPFQRGDDLQDFANKRVYLEHALNENVAEQRSQEQRIVEAEQRVIEQQEVLKQCGIDVKALEKLRDKQREEHRLEQLREEGLFLDDLAGQGFLRRRALRAQINEEERIAAQAALDAPPPPPASAPPPPSSPSPATAGQEA